MKVITGAFFGLMIGLGAMSLAIARINADRVTDLGLAYGCGLTAGHVSMLSPVLDPPLEREWCASYRKTWESMQ